MVQLISGRAELFGKELAPNRAYEFHGGMKVAIFTWEGCQLEIQGQPSVLYSAGETPMRSYLNVHLALENLRRRAQLEHTKGPKVNLQMLKIKQQILIVWIGAYCG